MDPATFLGGIVATIIGTLVFAVLWVWLEPRVRVELAKRRLFELQVPRPETQSRLRIVERTLQLPSASEQPDDKPSDDWVRRESIREKLEEIETMIDLGYADARVWCTKGDLLEQLRQPEEALTCYSRALELNPDHAESLRRRGLLNYNVLKRWDDAAADFQQLKRDPKYREEALVLFTLASYEQRVLETDRVVAGLLQAIRQKN